MKYVIVIDTNIFFTTGQKSCNFSEFKLNKLFDNVIEAIEKYDLTENVTVMIPKTVWNELYKQRLELYDNKIRDIEKLHKNFIFPNVTVEIDEIDYPQHLRNSLDIYRQKLSNYTVEVRELELPTESRFGLIIKRVFEKRAPFEGRGKSSDKGFKDALIWESILEFKSINPEVNILLYSRDGLFNQELSTEFEEQYSDSIVLLDTEELVINTLEQISAGLKKDIVKKSEDISIYDQIEEILNREDFIFDLLSSLEISYEERGAIYDFSFIDSIKIINIVDISSDDSVSFLSFQANLEANLTFSLAESSTIEDINIFEEMEIIINYVQGEHVLTLNSLSVLNNEYLDINEEIEMMVNV
ncbi:PIN domain-containing protein [Cytobacillus firmus]|uniref:PIN domain-containing protein n=1 Tax=Cytobacillus firmus TaxID=1399 RepID=UPI0022281A68|nr:PIN domain-containing protein [Cytobacillus firmus]